MEPAADLPTGHRSVELFGLGGEKAMKSRAQWQLADAKVTEMNRKVDIAVMMGAKPVGLIVGSTAHSSTLFPSPSLFHPSPTHSSRFKPHRCQRCLRR